MASFPSTLHLVNDRSTTQDLASIHIRVFRTSIWNVSSFLVTTAVYELGSSVAIVDTSWPRTEALKAFLDPDRVRKIMHYSLLCKFASCTKKTWRPKLPRSTLRSRANISDLCKPEDPPLEFLVPNTVVQDTVQEFVQTMKLTVSEI